MKNNKKRLIPFSKPSIGKEEKNRVLKVLESDWLTSGPTTKKFEEEFAKFNESKYAISLNSCTAALYLSLIALGIKRGDEVITSPLTFTSVANVCLHIGAKPVFVDIDSKTYLIDTNKIKRAITKRTKAIIPIHYGGQACDMDKIIDLAKKHNLKIIEDCAHAPGADYKRKKVGNFGDTGCFSFYATKNITTGEGGMITTNNKELAEKFILLRLHGMSKESWKRYHSEGSWHYNVTIPGFKENMSEIQSALGIEQLKKLNNFNNKRREIAEYYKKNLSEIKEIKLIGETGNGKNVFHLYPIEIEVEKLKINRAEFIRKLNERGIGTSVHFIPLHLQPLYQKIGYKKGDFPITEKAYKGLISLPIYPKLTKKDLDYIINNLKEIIKENEN